MPNKTLEYYEALPYRVVIVPEGEGEGWSAEYPELQGCIAHGDSREEALSNSEVFKSEWLSAALEAGIAIPEPKPGVEASGKLVLRLPKSLHQRATDCAAAEKVSLNTYLVSAVSECVSRSATKQVYNMVEALLRKGVGHLLPTAQLESILVKIGIAVEPVYGEKEHPVGIDALEQKENAPPQVPAASANA